MKFHLPGELYAVGHSLNVNTGTVGPIAVGNIQARNLPSLQVALDRGRWYDEKFAHCHYFAIFWNEKTEKWQKLIDTSVNGIPLEAL